jgi:hypothetical protein
MMLCAELRAFMRGGVPLPGVKMSLLGLFCVVVCVVTLLCHLETIRDTPSHCGASVGLEVPVVMVGCGCSGSSADIGEY